MGLDMYIFAKQYASPYFGEEHFPALKALAVGNLGMPLAESFPSIEIKTQAAYWRKSNQIHKWFVDNVQNGVDECQYSYVSIEQLQKLRDLCQRAIDTKDPSLLPPYSGFFLGSTDVDDYYWADLKDTIEQLDRCIAKPEFDYEYHSSW